MGTREFEGKNVDMAVWQASQELQIAIEEMRYEILSKGKRGGEPARIRVVVGAGEPEQRPHEPRERAPVPQGGRREPPGRASVPQGGRREPPARIQPAMAPAHAEAGAPDEEGMEDDLPVAGALPGGREVAEDDPIEEARHARRAVIVAEDEPREKEPEPVERPYEDERGEQPGDEDEEDEEDEDEEEEEEDEEAEEDEGEEDVRRERHEEIRKPPRAAAPDEDLKEGMEKARRTLPALLSGLGLDLEVAYELREDHVYIALQGDDGEFLLGERADGLNALQFLLNKMVYRGGQARLVVDVNGYRRERQDKLVAEAKEAAREVRETGRSRTLGPMNPFERRLIHLALRDDPDVQTVSHGDSFLKRLEIRLRRDGGEARRPRGGGHWGDRRRGAGRR